MLMVMKRILLALALVLLHIPPIPAFAEWPYFLATNIQATQAQIQDGCDDGVHCDATSPLSYVLDVNTQQQRHMLTWVDQGYNLSTVTWELALEVGHTYQIFMSNAVQPGSYSYSQQFVYDPTSFMAMNASVNHATGEFSFDYNGYNGGNIMAVSLRNDRPATSYNWPAGEVGYGPLTCTATHCSGMPSHLTGTIACSDNLIFDIYDGSNEYFSNNFTVSHIDTDCQVPVPGLDWPTFQKNAQHTGFAESETQLTTPLDTLWSLDTPAVNYQSMVVADNTMYVGLSGGSIKSINVSDGSVNWSVATNSSERLTYANGTLYSVGGCGGCSVEARNPANGQLLWSSPFGSGITSGITAGGNRLYIGTGNNTFLALDSANGSPVWGYHTFDPMFGWPALMAGNDDLVYIGVYQNSPNQLALYEASPGVGAALWSTNRILGASTPTALKGKLYWANSGSSGSAVAFDANNGGVQWSNSSVLGGTTATAVAYDTVYVRGHGGRVTAINTNNGQTRWIYNDGALGDLHTPVVVANNIVYEASFDNKINALNAQTGALMWQYTADSKVTALIVANHMLLAGTEGGKILAFGVNPAPSVGTLAGATINAGTTYTENGSFTDQGSVSWTATVDYGDGTGTQPLPLSGNNFSLNHQYNTPDTYHVTVTVTDNQGLSGTAEATVIVNQVLPVTVNFSPSADTHVRSGQSNHNYGGLDFMRLQSSGDNRALVKFDQQSLAAGIHGTVLSAKLRLTIVDNGNNWGTTGRTIDLNRLTADWAEGNGTENSQGSGSGATWACAIDSIISNSAKNCSGATEWEMGQPNNPLVHPWNATVTDSQNITNGQSGVVEFNVTADVQDFINGSSNYGWLLKKTVEGQAGQVSFSTKEGLYTPQLVVVYQP
jgi:outer membrane protein assembly factor BamB